MNKICKDCGKKLKQSTSIRCRKCYYLFAKGENAPNIKHGRYCKNKHYYCKCGKKLYGYRSKFCRNCCLDGKRHPFYHKKRPDFAKKISGKNHPAYIPGLNRKYPIRFDNQLKESIRKRDNYKCQNCNMTEEEHIKYNKQILHIHHIDYNKNNCKEDNLITLCIRCNSKVNYNRDYWFSYFRYIMER